MVKQQVKTYEFAHLAKECSYNRKAWHLKFETFQPAAFRALLPPDDVRANFKGKVVYTKR